MISLCHKALRSIPALFLGVGLALGAPGCETTRAHLKVTAAHDANARQPGEPGAPTWVLIRVVTPDAFAADDYASIEALASQALTGKLPEGVPAPPVRVPPGQTTWVSVKLPAGQTWAVYALFTEARDDGSWKRLMTPGKLNRIELGRSEIEAP